MNKFFALMLGIFFLILKISSGYITENKSYQDLVCLLNIFEEDNIDVKHIVDLSLCLPLEELDFLKDQLLYKYNTNIEKLKKDFLKGNLSKHENLKKDIKKFKTDYFKNSAECLEDVNISVKHPTWFLNLNECQRKMCERICELNKSYFKKYKCLKDTDEDTFLRFDGVLCVLGGRFNEMYYWDTYWVIIGLLDCEMEQEAFLLIKSFVNIIKRIGFVPNATRLYYLNRSHPPFFLHMLNLIYNRTNNNEIKNFILFNGLDAAITEYKFFMEMKSVMYNGYNLNIYKVHSNQPRLETYKYDLKTYANSNYNINLYKNLATGAESGWDFSTRWLTDNISLHTIDIINIIPVDLNAIMFKNELILLDLIEKRNLLKKSVISKDLILEIDQSLKNRKKAMRKVLWNIREGVWNDFNIKSKSFSSSRFYISNIYPLFWNVDILPIQKYSILLKYHKELFGYIGVVPVSGESEDKVVSGHQWDFPNTWAPCTQLFIEFLVESNERKLALHVARSYYLSVKNEYNRDKLFYEKYNCLVSGEEGKGGEYPVQNGFGWTNGTLIYIMKIFGKELDDEFDHQKSYKNIIEYLSNKILSYKMVSE